MSKQSGNHRTFEGRSCFEQPVIVDFTPIGVARARAVARPRAARHRGMWTSRSPRSTSTKEPALAERYRVAGSRTSPCFRMASSPEVVGLQAKAALEASLGLTQTV